MMVAVKIKHVSHHTCNTFTRKLLYRSSEDTTLHNKPKLQAKVHPKMLTKHTESLVLLYPN